MSIERERRRLDRAFQVVLLTVGGPAVVMACASSSGCSGGDDSPKRPDGSLGSAMGPDSGTASKPDDGGAPDRGAPDAGAGVAQATDAGATDAAIDQASCYQGAFEIEAGPDAGDAQDTCGYVYSCGLAGTGLANVGCAILDQLPDGNAVPLLGMTCWLAQDAGCDDDAFVPGVGVTILCTPCPNGGGRRPAALARRRRDRVGGSVLAYFAAMAYEESAAVVAFERLGDEMRRLGAPRSLRRAAARAVRDERRHAQMMSRLRDAHGGRAVAGVHGPNEVALAGLQRPKKRQRTRTVAALAAENAAEGCVRETYGALLAQWQALRARDPEVRAAFARVAADEAKHAAFSWALTRWLGPRLDEASRRRVERYRRRAIRDVAESLAVEPPHRLVVEAGLPRAAQSRALFFGMLRELDAHV